MTGAAGFVGRFMVSMLAPDFRVAGLGSEAAPDWLQDSIDWYTADLLKPDSLADLPTEWWGVIHLAAHTVPSSFADDSALRDNVDMTRNLLERLDPTRFLFASSGLVYAPSRTQVNEDSLIEPQGPYGASKYLCEDLLRKFSDRLDVRIARPFNHVGPGMQPKLAIPSIMRRVLDSRLSDAPIEMLGQDSTRDFIDVRDVVAAYVTILGLDSPEHDTYNVCTGRPTSIRAVVETALGILGIERDVRFAEEAISADDTSWLVGDSSRLSEETDWAPMFSLTDSLRDMLSENQGL